MTLVLLALVVLLEPLNVRTISMLSMTNSESLLIRPYLDCGFQDGDGFYPNVDFMNKECNVFVILTQKADDLKLRCVNPHLGADWVMMALGSSKNNVKGIQWDIGLRLLHYKVDVFGTNVRACSPIVEWTVYRGDFGCLRFAGIGKGNFIALTRLAKLVQWLKQKYYHGVRDFVCVVLLSWFEFLLFPSCILCCRSLVFTTSGC